MGVQTGQGMQLPAMVGETVVTFTEQHDLPFGEFGEQRGAGQCLAAVQAPLARYRAIVGLGHERCTKPEKR